MASKLQRIANDMIRATAHGGKITRTLSRGLEMRLTVAETHKGLTLVRPAVPPSEAEVRICRDAFGVPETARRFNNGNQVILTWPIV